MYLEKKGQDMSIEPKEVSNEDYIYNYIPRGVLTPGGVNLLTDQLTSPYTRGKLQFEYQDQLYEFTCEFRRMPLTMAVTIKYYLDSFTDTLELMQYIVTHLNFIRNFQIIYLGQSIPCSYKFPENLDEEFNAEFDGLSQDSKYKTLEVQLEVETNLPVYYPRTAIESDLTISGEQLWKVTWLYNGSDIPEDWYFEGYTSDGSSIVSKAFSDEDQAFNWAKDNGGTMRRISKVLWNSRPVFENDVLKSVENQLDQRLTEKIVR
jgi:hypothetical protein